MWSLMQLAERYTPRVKETLLKLLSKSELLEAGVWMDSTYTPLEDLFVRDAIDGHETYLKLEARIERKSPSK